MVIGAVLVLVAGAVPALVPALALVPVLANARATDVRVPVLVPVPAAELGAVLAPGAVPVRAMPLTTAARVRLFKRLVPQVWRTIPLWPVLSLVPVQEPVQEPVTVQELAQELVLAVLLAPSWLPTP
jgi:hypothetical protein